MDKKPRRSLRINYWLIILLVLAVPGIILGCLGFSKHDPNRSNNLYETFQLFFLNIPSDPQEERMSGWQLQWSKWLIFAATLWATLRLFIEIIAPQFIKKIKIWAYFRNHIVIYGLNKITINLTKKFENENIVVIAEEINKYAEALKTKNVEVLIGDISNNSFLQKTKIKQAGKFIAINDIDKKNVLAAQIVYSIMESTHETRKLDCFILIKDRELKNILEETELFKNETKFCEGTLFDINEMGIKYGISTNIDMFLPKRIDAVPEILLVGLSEKTEIILHNLAHCLTMKNESFKFTVLEENEDAIRSFTKKYAYLSDFAQIKFTANIKTDSCYSVILICLDSHTESIKQAYKIHYLLGEKVPNIVVFCNEDTFSEVLDNDCKKKNIFLLNIFEQIADYVFKLNDYIEDAAKGAHRFWNERYNMNKEWDELSGHFKQSNRNQVLDNYIRIYVARGIKFEDYHDGLISFSDNEKETLSNMEHRRWMLEKYANGWIRGTRNNDLKRHDCLVQWNELSEKDRAKDGDAIDLMINILNTQ